MADLKTTAPATKPATTQVSITDYVQKDIDKLISENGLVMPPDYAVGNAIQSAYLTLLNVVDRDKRPALTVCDKSSIVYAIRNMIIQGLNVDKKQGYFIVYGNQLQFQRSYFGTLAVAKRFANVQEIVPQFILRGDEVETEIINGEEQIISHKRKRNFEETVSIESIVGAYCIIKLRNGGVKWEIMDKGQIHAAWNKSKTGQSVHKEFPDQMAMKTVIGRALKLIINSSDDAPILVKAFNESGYIADEDEETQISEFTIPEGSFSQEVSPEVLLKADEPQKEEIQSPSKPIQSKLPIGADPF